ncbi:hypothetical protein PTSG_02150 [Salpingoeca rosetta]|uniref:Uncharacterized protein n=1 Tax=Salpingoeca rosetta (strain ATCC 50818 / BSB-021) TaxID=946362 RepID=F2U1C7_SALR5|nr:uncharacterized protein PTSG_02150 [Salpingoeca rosetta]EGD81429.1 hypothetical protein PTSG_02150 [Salpingoeca rosetta]|eukprot:XP_004996633.1 hypothetical protein PTSG_02150 [Salpingoeca rosetta]
MNATAKSLFVELCWLSIALVTIVLSIFTAQQLLRLESDLNDLHSGNMDKLRTCLFNKPATTDCPDPASSSYDPDTDPCVTYQNPAEDNDNTFRASRFFSCANPDFCRTFFEATENGTSTGGSGTIVAGLSKQWNNVLTYQGISIPYLFVGGLMGRAASGVMAAFLETFQMCRIRLSKSFLKGLLYLKNITGVLSCVVFFLFWILLDRLDRKSIIQDVIDARCYDFDGLKVLAAYDDALDAAKVDQIGFSVITIFTLIGETLTFDDDFANVIGSGSSDITTNKGYAEHVNPDRLSTRLITNENEDDAL